MSRTVWKNDGVGEVGGKKKDCMSEGGGVWRSTAERKKEKRDISSASS